MAIPTIYAKNQSPASQFLQSIGIANVDANGQATGTTGGSTFMWEDQQKQYADLKAQEQPNQFLPMATPGATNTPTGGQMPANSFLQGAGGAPGGAIPWVNTRPGTQQPSGVPMIGRDAPAAAPAPTPLSAFGKQVLASPTPINRDGAIFSGAGGKLSITQDMGTIPMGGKPQAGGVDPLAVARYQQAVASGGDVNAILSAYRTPVPEGVTLSEQEAAQLAMDDMRINQQAMQLAGRVSAQGMAPTAGTTGGAMDNRMQYIQSLGGGQPDNRFMPQGQPVNPAQSVRDKLNQKPLKTVDVIVGDEVVTYDANTKQELGRAPRTALPAGYERDPNGGVKAIAGTKDAVEMDRVKEKEDLKRSQDIEKANVVIQAIDEVIPKISNLTAGLGGAMTSFVPGTESYDVGATIDTIKANIGFDQLSAMRAASPTGGALGQVAVQELNFLQATLGNLKQGQSPDKLAENLYAVKYHYDRWKDTVSGVNPDTKPGRMLSPADNKRLRELRAKGKKMSNQAAKPGGKG